MAQGDHKLSDMHIPPPSVKRIIKIQVEALTITDHKTVQCRYDFMDRNNMQVLLKHGEGQKTVLLCSAKVDLRWKLAWEIRYH